MSDYLGDESYPYKLLVDILAEMVSLYVVAPNSSEDVVEEKKGVEEIEY
ncbi:hypothetical protein QMA04_00290 [Planococcus sp. APC 3900]|nr:hypothetical protein [Planococcus sp. APC 3900]MDN3436503.1 hypothetical protein [Planococcus sp. APC 3900]